ncbi:MAG: Rne/Rng family ribonuclease [Firmicutes bacterium]|nr:Rne/Rng family ribonuclease [Bacillota bacterium]
MEKEILVTVDYDETRVAVLEDGLLVEVYVERPGAQRIAGNIYKGRVENILPGMQAAFVDIGLERNAFLYVDDAAVPRTDDEDDDPGEEFRKRTIKDVLKPRQEILVQVVKEPIGTKGARVTRYFTLPGRYLVLMPMVDYVGVSRRIEGEQERDRLRKMADSIRPPGMGLIVRTVAEGKNEGDLSQDLDFLLRLWGRIQARAKNVQAPSIVHKDLGLVYRIVRDLFSAEVSRLYIDSRHEYEKVMELLDVTSPELKGRVHLFTAKDRSLFDLYGLETEIEDLLNKKVWLKSGGYLVIDQTEALTAIDVNTGKYVGTTNLADTVFKTNMEAAREIARQLRLRDIGGIIVIDFIDMQNLEHRQKVIAALENELRKDRTRNTVLGLTQLGLVEMTRKKVRQGLSAVLEQNCPYCHGKGRVLSESTMASKVRREVRRILKHSASEAALLEVHPSVASVLIGSGGANLRELEKETGKTVYVRGAANLHVESINLRSLGTKDEIEAKALPVKPGDVLELKVEEPHVSNPWDGIARLEGYVIDIEGAGSLVGEKVNVEVTKAFRTYAKAKIVKGVS